MSALQKLKAYFGMIPADSDGYDGYDSYEAADRYDEDYRRDYADEAYDGFDEEPLPRARRRYRDGSDYDEEGPLRARPRSPEPSVHGALAVERQPEPVARLRPVPEPARASAPRDALGRITTLHPTSYVEARGIGEAYREGIPVIINLTQMENADAKRLVDFAAGLAFALRGSMDKITNKVFLLSPPDVEVTAEERRRIAEGGLFLRH
ncbi:MULTISPECIES: cell division protein SepF [Amycolatopsis]|uniref:Cell division protein SepF n=1 Tax=Amycolatopsis thermoflava TaxID=84480 RepID=A0A3N2GNS6_9PSEU|nr:cell division protein SepF [Amycolatopsis thermoflava]ROS38284.1 cell division inhibitor SepF [Amycolatopsis thermoflava]